MDKLKIYNQVREVPKEAQKSIGAGRLKGMTDIKPMWRIKKLTEVFGPVGIGWYYEIERMWKDEGSDGAITANVEIKLYVKYDGEWSEPIQGIGGSMLVAKESKGLYTNDECYKMALTDAISVACKALGMGADVYWDKDNTKYNDVKKTNFNEQKAPEFHPAGEQLPFDNDFEECCECHTQVSKKMAQLCESKYGYVVCSQECKNKHEVRKLAINGE